MRTLSIILLLLIQSSVFSQINVKEKYEPHEPIVLNCECPGPDGSKKHIIWEISGKAKLREIGGEACVWAPPGKYEVSSTVLLTIEKKIGDQLVEVLVPGGFKRFRAEFQVTGKTPEPEPDDPTPTPSNCSGLEGRAKTVCGMVTDTVPARAQNRRVALGKMFGEAASGLESGKLLTINDSNKYIRDTIGGILDTQVLKDDWAKFQVRLGDMLLEAANNRAQIIQFYKDTSLGLIGG